MWSLHPKYLDARGLVALWREALLAQKVLKGQTKGYRHHPQLKRFLDSPDPLTAISAYLEGICQEASKRGYCFDSKKICRKNIDYSAIVMPLNRGQLEYEFRLLMDRLLTRSLEKYKELIMEDNIEPNPVFKLVDGGVAEWEKVKVGGGEEKASLGKALL